jgi:hypothetical protein
VRYLTDKLPETHMVLLGLLPRGGPNPHYTYRQPSIYSRAIDLLSWHIK